MTPGLFNMVEPTPVYTVRLTEGRAVADYATALDRGDWPDRMTLEYGGRRLTFNNPRERRMFAAGWLAALRATAHTD